jgi:AraC family transcriptional regulator of adaptative response/methylated-DNA-[protein]-cysteine methyltransferase
MDETLMVKDERIQAVLERDDKFDGEFVYGVKSTKIFCRPSCPSRRPKLENIIIFDNAQMAEDTGFRPCKRCKPKHSLPPNEALTERITSYTALHLEDKLTLSHLASKFNISKYHLQRTFKSVLGISPRQYIESKRLESFKARIRDGENVDSAMTKAGFKSRSRLYEKVPEKLGMTPTEYKEGGYLTSIWFTTFDTQITKVLIARTNRGICALYLGIDKEGLIGALEMEYPNASLDRDDSSLRESVDQLKSYFDGENYNPRLPLDVHRTTFQWKVLKAIQNIPVGETRTYSELAETIGNVRAVRAVAGACASNPVGVLIPCHRVVRKNGGLGGYRWGVPLKEKLLQHESNLSRDD